MHNLGWWRVICLVTACAAVGADCPEHEFLLSDAVCKACVENQTRDTSLVRWWRFENEDNMTYDAVSRTTDKIDIHQGAIDIVPFGILGHSMTSDSNLFFLTEALCNTKCIDAEVEAHSWTMSFLTRMNKLMLTEETQLMVAFKIKGQHFGEQFLLHIYYKKNTETTQENNLEITDSVNSFIAHSSGILPGDSRLVAVSYNDTSQELRVHIGEESWEITYSSSGYVVFLNARVWSLFSFDASEMQLDDLRLYKRTLTATEIAALGRQAAAREEYLPCSTCATDDVTGKCSCAAGAYRNGSACTPCPRHTYKSGAGADRDRCRACPIDTTAATESTAQTDCLCPSRSVLNEVFTTLNFNTTLTRLRDPDDPETAVVQDFWVRGSVAVHNIRLHNVVEIIRKLWGDTEDEGWYPLQIIFYRDTTPLVRQYIRPYTTLEGNDQIESVLDDTVDADTPSESTRSMALFATSALGLFEHIQHLQGQTTTGNSILAEKARRVWEGEPESTIRATVTSMLPAYATSNVEARLDVAMQWSQGTHANASHCVPCPTHAVIALEDPRTGAPRLCVPCGRDAVFFPGATLGGTCEACPEGTFRHEGHATCQPLYPAAGQCAATYTEAGLNLDTSEAMRPVARWNDTNATKLRAVLQETASNCSCRPGSVLRYVPILAIDESPETSGDLCTGPERFLACVQTERNSTLPFWESLLTYTTDTGHNTVRARMCVPTSRAGPDPDTDDFSNVTNTPGFHSVRPVAAPLWSEEVVLRTPARTVSVDGADQDVYIPRAEYPSHRGMRKACTAESLPVTVPAVAVALEKMEYVRGIFLDVDNIINVDNETQCEAACRNNWQCLWFSHAAHECSLGIGHPHIALPRVDLCENDTACMAQNVFPPFEFRADASAVVYVWKPGVLPNTSPFTDTICAETRPTCPSGSVRKLATHGLCEECGRNNQPMDQVCQPCPPAQPTRKPTKNNKCQQCVLGQFLHAVTKECLWCNVNHERDHTNTSACAPCVLGKYRAADDDDCISCPHGFSGHYDRDQLGCARCDGNAPRCPCPAGWTPDTTGTGGCTPCHNGTAKPETGTGTCAPCRAGLVAPQHGAAVCVPCARDRGPDFTTREDCLPPRDATPATPPTTCPPGYEVVPTYAVCMPCGRGWYKTTSGTGPCLSCPAQIRDAVYNASSCPLVADCDVQWAVVHDAAPQAILHPDIAPRPRVLPFPPCSEANTTADPDTCECLAGHQRETVSTCAPCPAGTFKAGIGDTENCEACPRGFFQAAPGKASCVPCPMGTHDPDPDPAANRSTEAAACQPCPANATTTFVAAHNCVCMPGYTDHDATGCVACAENTFQPYLQSGAACTPCPNGTSGTRGGDRLQCEECPQNEHWDDVLDRCMCSAGYQRRRDTSTASCIACGQGLFRNSSMDNCAACRPGEYAANLASTACVACAYGTWAMDPTQASCEECEHPGTVFNTTSGQCSITCAVDEYARDSTSCEKCPAFTYATNSSVVCTACGAHTERQTGACVCNHVQWQNVTWDNHPLGHPMTSCVPRDSHCPQSAEHQRVVAWRLHAVVAHNATEEPGCPREAFDIDFMPSGVDEATHRARYVGTHAETGETWELAWSLFWETYTIHRAGEGVVAHFSVPGALREYVRWEDTPGNRLDAGLFWNCSGETVDVRPVLECAACVPGQYFARSMTMSAIVPDSTPSTECRARAAYFEGEYEFHGEWHNSFSTVYRHNTRPLSFILNTHGAPGPILQIHGAEHSIAFVDSSVAPVGDGMYDAPGFRVNVSLGPSELNMSGVGGWECVSSATWNFEIKFDSQCLSCNASNETNHQGWRFGDEASRELYWEQDGTHNDMPWYVAQPTGSQRMALAYMHIPELGYDTYAIVDQAKTCWSPPSPSACALADLDAFYNMSHAGSRRVHITQVYGDSDGLGHWESTDAPVQLARCTEYECPRGMYALGEETPQYRLDCEFCPPGTYDNGDGLGCTSCLLVGKYSELYGQVNVSSCQQCASGWEVDNFVFFGIAFYTCKECPLGLYKSQNGTETCSVCTLGKYSPTTTSECIECHAGTYGTEADTGDSRTYRTCTACPGGKYQETTGRTLCKNCFGDCELDIGDCGGDSGGNSVANVGLQCDLTFTYNVTGNFGSRTYTNQDANLGDLPDSTDFTVYYVAINLQERGEGIFDVYGYYRENPDAEWVAIGEPILPDSNNKLFSAVTYTGREFLLQIRGKGKDVNMLTVEIQ